MKCENCGHIQKDKGRSKGGKNKWKNKTKAEKREIMRVVREGRK